MVSQYSTRTASSRERHSLAGLTQWFKQQQEGFISREELEQINLSIQSELFQADLRVAALETKSGSSQRIISEASQAIIFLQGSWVYQQAVTGQKLRYLVTEKGYPLLNRNGSPLTSIDGNGPIASRRFTGTAFVINAQGRLMTNRHVARPWETDPALATMREMNIQPAFEEFLGYLPGMVKPFNVLQESISQKADIAILQCSIVTQ